MKQRFNLLKHACTCAQLSGTNVFWGDRGGQNVDEPAPWHNNEGLTVNQMSDGDWVPDAWVQGGPSHSSGRALYTPWNLTSKRS